MNKDVVHIHNGILLSHKKNKIMPFAATWMELEILILSGVSHKETQYGITYIWNLMYGTNESFCRKETDGLGEQTCGCQGEGEGGGSGMDWRFGVSRCKLLHLEWISNEVLLYSAGDDIHSLGIDYDVR